jgi:peptidyl-prolyl cis-trans isomerase B (cyclophilin B)
MLLRLRGVAIRMFGMAGDLRKFAPYLAIAIILILVIISIRGSDSAKPVSPVAPAAQGKSGSTPPAMTIDKNKEYTATFTTSRGKIVCDLFPKDAPVTVNNFVSLARSGFYKGTVFHRVIKDFMIQGGDPTASGSGGPGYQFADESNGKVFQTGTLAMANAGPDTNGSQFFITHKPTPWLQGKHTIFGQVREGQDVVNAVQQGDKLENVAIEEK